jgi:hypothetical protein
MLAPLVYFSLGFVEGLTNKIRVIQRRAYGLRDEGYLRLKVLTCRSSRVPVPRILWDALQYPLTPLPS